MVRTCCENGGYGEESAVTTGRLLCLYCQTPIVDVQKENSFFCADCVRKHGIVWDVKCPKCFGSGAKIDLPGLRIHCSCEKGRRLWRRDAVLGWALILGAAAVIVFAFWLILTL